MAPRRSEAYRRGFGVNVRSRKLRVWSEDLADAVPAPRGVESEEESAHADQPQWTTTRTPVGSAPFGIVEDHPNPGVIVHRATGDIGGPESRTLKDRLLGSVRSAAHTVVVDLTEVSFLSVAGLQVLSAVKQCATLNRTNLVLVTEQNAAVLRPMRAMRIAVAQGLARRP